MVETGLLAMYLSWNKRTQVPTTFIARNQFPHTVVDLKTYLCTDSELKEGRGAGRKNARKISYSILYGIPSINQPSFRPLEAPTL